MSEVEKLNKFKCKRNAMSDSIFITHNNCDFTMANAQHKTSLSVSGDYFYILYLRLMLATQKNGEKIHKHSANFFLFCETCQVCLNRNDLQFVASVSICKQ